MNELAKLAPRPGAQKNRKRVGRGPGSGHGKTAGRGTKGQLARSSRVRPAFEGGQTPLIRRIPIRGFSHAAFHVTYQVVNVADLAEFAAGSVVTPEVLAEAGLIRKADELVKVLGGGAVANKLTVRAHKFSKTAADKIKAKGGAAELLSGGAATAPAGAPAKG
jgi:large subunit ribosomal protein L15